MRILLTAHQFLPHHRSGTEILTYTIASQLASRGHHVRIFTGHPSKVHVADENRFDSYEYDGLTVHRFLHQHMPMGGQTNIVEMEYRNEFFKSRFKAFLEQERPDVVHFIHLYRLTTTAIDACRELGIPTVFTPTDFWFVCPLIQMRLPDGSLCEGPNAVASNCVRHMAQVSGDPKIIARIEKIPNWALAAGTFAIRHGFAPRTPTTDYVSALTHRQPYMRREINTIDRVLVPSRIMERMLQKHGLERDRTTYLPYGVNTDGIVRDIRKGVEEKLRVGFIATLAEHKGAHILIEAVRKISNAKLDVRIYGNLEEFPNYIEKLRQLAGDDTRISFPGIFAREKIGTIFQEMDVLVVPSVWYENTPLVIYDAMAAGVPVVASRLGGMSESVEEGVNGLLFEPSDRDELAKDLKQLDDDRKQVSAFSSRTKLPMTIPEHVTRLEAIYYSLLKL